ncbi:cell division cycle protein 27 homolog [Aricia agestis]|uniref:cell division cycle protein 27 homolog n=1 Tax=Aricia agestis TaxID=91739 RepID=UPI001C20AC2C|nr:cell division cycle protein 27 homolog [Aricia agestis]XP_041986616.1 cell division cycle protein 27 homolog [Aricia agestis]
MIVQEPIQVIVWDCLNNYEYDNAIFLAERLHAEVSSEETAFLLGTCYYRAGRINETFYLLHNITLTLPQARYLLAKCSVDLKSYKDAEAVLGTNLDIVASEFGEQAPYALQLLAKIYNITERRSKAAEAHRKALSLNPFMWKSFSQLCNMGEKVDPHQVFQINNSEFTFGVSTLVNLVSNSENISIINSNIPNNTSFNLNITPNNIATRTPMSVSTSITPETQAPVKRMHSVFSGMAPIPFSPSFGMLPVEESPVLYTPTLTDSNEQKAIPKIVNSLRAHVGQLKDAVFSPSPRCTLGPAPRRSSRLFSNNNSSYSVKENNKSPSRKFVAPKSPSRKNKQRKNIKGTTESNERNKSMETVTPTLTPKSTNGVALLGLLKELGEAYKSLAFLDCKTAIKQFQEIPHKQLHSPWVQTMIAKAHYELAQYEAAVKIFVEIRKQHPNRTEGMDVYSTCLWHLQREAQLSALAQELVELNRNDSIAWLAAGNCFSLHKERETALKFFKRAVQIDPDAAYGHALLGHEYAVAEESDKALSSFRTAVSIDPRNYVAWFGIATVFARQERWKASEVHIRRALAIHPHSGVLRCQLGLAQAALGKMDRALSTLERAVALDKENPLCRFHRASVLLRAGRPEDALADLNHLKDIAPRESLVYYLLGKVYNKLGDSHLALMHFSWATDLDPKGTGGHIKEGFDPSKQDDPPEKSS